MKKSLMQPKTGPRLAQAIADGHVWYENGEYFGLAADAEVVQIGSQWNLNSIESYLESRPTPDLW